MYFIHNLVRSCTTFVAAVSRSKLPGHPALGEFLGELGSIWWREIHPFGPFGSWYPRWMSTRWDSRPKRKWTALYHWKRREPTKKTPMICWKWTHVQKTAFQRFWVVSEADLKIQAANSNTKASLKYLADQKKHLTWNPGCFYVVEFTTSLYRDHNQRFLRFLIIYQPCFSCFISPSNELFVASAPVTPKASPLQSYRSLAWQ